MHKTWLARVHDVLAKLSNKYQPEDCYLGERRCSDFQEQMKNPYVYGPACPYVVYLDWRHDESHAGYGLGKTFMNPEYSCPTTIYLFLQDVKMDEQGRLSIPEFFWAIDPEGQSRLSAAELEEYWDIISGDPILKVWWRHYSWPWYVYGPLFEIQKACGFDPATDAFAKCLGITDEIEIEPSELRFNEGTPLNCFTSEQIQADPMTFCTSADDDESSLNEGQIESEQVEASEEDNEPLHEGWFIVALASCTMTKTDMTGITFVR